MNLHLRCSRSDLYPIQNHTWRWPGSDIKRSDFMSFVVFANEIWVTHMWNTQIWLGWQAVNRRKPDYGANGGMAPDWRSQMAFDKRTYPPSHHLWFLDHQFEPLWSAFCLLLCWLYGDRRERIWMRVSSWEVILKTMTTNWLFPKCITYSSVW